MKVIGLTGDIGSGKSTVAGFLERLGARCLDLDKTGHGVLLEDSSVKTMLVDEFGEGILDSVLNPHQPYSFFGTMMLTGPYSVIEFIFKCPADINTLLRPHYKSHDRTEIP